MGFLDRAKQAATGAMGSIKKQIADSTDPLTPGERNEWLAEQANLLGETFADKFKRGEKEHGGDLGHLPIRALLDEQEQEALDMLSYVREIKRRLGLK